MESSKLTIIVKGENKKIEKFEDPALEAFRKDLETTPLDQVVYLSLSGNSYGPEFAEKLAPYIAKMTKLEVLNVSDTFVSRDKVEIPKSIELLFDNVSSTLHSVDLSNNAMGPHGSAAISIYLSKGPANLKRLFINNCGLGAGGLKILSEALIKGKINLEQLSIGRNRMEDDGVISLSAALKNMPALKDVRVFQNFIRNKGMGVLLSTLNEACPDVETLDVNDNYVKNEAVGELAKFIKTHKKLRILNVSDCNIEGEDNTAIIEALEASEAVLEKLGYNYNSLGESAEHKRFIDAVVARGAGKLQRVDVKGNELKKAARAYFTEKAPANVLSAFESDDDGEDVVAKEFAELKIF